MPDSVSGQNTKYSIGVDIGGSHISACIYEHTTSRLIKETLVNREVDTTLCKEEIIENWVMAISECQNKLKVDISGVAIAMPGPFDYYNGICLIKGVKKLQALYNVNIRRILAQPLQFLPSRIRFINDATAFSIAEVRIGQASKYKRAVALTLGTGLGSAFMIDGKPIIQDKSVPEGGFLYNKYYGDEIADDLFSTRGIIKQYKSLSNKEIPNVKALCDLLDEDPCAKQTFSEFGENLGAFLLPYLLEFSAEVLILGGNIAKAFPYFGPRLTNRLPKMKVYVSEFGEEATIIGCAMLNDDAYYNAIKPTIKLM